MYCRFCGTPLPEDGLYCGSCGRPVRDTAAPLPAAPQGALRTTASVWLGLLFLLGGVLPLLFQTDSQAWQDTLQEAIRYGSETIAALSCLNRFIHLLAPLFQITASASAVLVGALLLRRAERLRAALIFCAVAQSAAILRVLIVYILVYCAPEWAVSRFIDAAEVVQSAGLALRAQYFDASRNLALAGAAVSGGLIVPSVLLARRYRQGQPRRPLVGIALLAPVLALLNMVQGILSASLGRAFGDHFLAAGQLADATFSAVCGPVCLVLLLAALLLSVWLRKGNPWAVTLPLLGTLLLLAAVACLLAPQLLEARLVSAEWMALSLACLRGKIIGAALVLSAAIVWFQAVARGRLPMWLQITLPLLCLLIYPVFETLGFTLLQSPALPLGALMLAQLLAIPALTVRCAAPAES